MTTSITATASSSGERPRILVTGGTGYIGGRLVPRLLERGWRVRCLVRSRRKLESRPWITADHLEIVEGDALEPEAVRRALEGCAAAYYLIHSMIAAGDAYHDRDLAIARTFRAASAEVGVERIIYLGGLGETGDELSPHLASRRDVEAELRDGAVPVTVLRAAMIIGSGSASFEILRYLVERLPIMVTPRWVSTECQPIAVANVITALAECLEQPDTTGATLDIGGPDVVTYRELMQSMARARGLPRRIVLPLPVLTPRLSSLWIHLVTPLSAQIARPLAEGLRNRVVCRHDDAQRLVPDGCYTVDQAIERALAAEEGQRVPTSWSDAGPMPGDPEWSGGRTFVDARQRDIEAPADAVFGAVRRIGGREGYFSASLLWRMRGWLDRLVGGPGLRRGRRDPERVAYGDAIDFWRVTDYVEGRRLELRAEMRLPGVATLTFEVEPIDAARSTLTQTARFRPLGLLGLAYWYAVAPLHHIVFNGMLRGVAASVRSRTSPRAPEPVADAR